MAPRGRLFAIHHRGVRWLAKEIVRSADMSSRSATTPRPAPGICSTWRPSLTPSTPFLSTFSTLSGQNKGPSRAPQSRRRRETTATSAVEEPRLDLPIRPFLSGSDLRPLRLPRSRRGCLRRPLRLNRPGPIVTRGWPSLMCASGELLKNRLCAHRDSLFELGTRRQLRHHPLRGLARFRLIHRPTLPPAH